MFKTPVEFSLYIETMVLEKNLTHMEALLQFCEDNTVDPIEIKDLVTKSLKDKVRSNFKDIGLLVKEAELEFDDE